MREIQRISITDAVVDSIKEMIETEEYKAGEKLPAEAKPVSYTHLTLPTKA